MAFSLEDELHLVSDPSRFVSHGAVICLGETPWLNGKHGKLKIHCCLKKTTGYMLFLTMSSNCSCVWKGN